MHFGFMHAILLHSGDQHVSAEKHFVHYHKDTNITKMCLNRSPIWTIIHHLCLLCTSPHILQTTVLTSDTVYSSLFYFVIQPWILTENCVKF